jgi:hypothetical protein
VKSVFDFIGRTEIEKYSRLSRNTETGDSDKEALFASAGGVEVSGFLGGDTRQASRGVRSRSWTKKAQAPWSAKPYVKTMINKSRLASWQACYLI